MRKKRRKVERENTPDEIGQHSFNQDSHEHVFLEKDGRQIIKTKKDHPRKIDSLLRKGWRIVSR